MFWIPKNTTATDKEMFDQYHYLNILSRIKVDKGEDSTKVAKAIVKDMKEIGLTETRIKYKKYFD